MSPFSRWLAEFRKYRGLLQGELAAVVGYEQSYVSALEVGLKGPPTQEFVERLIDGLALSADEQVAVRDALRASQRKFILSLRADEEHFRLANRFWDKLPNLSPAKIRIIEELLSLDDPGSSPLPLSAKRVINTEARM